jgi:alpha-beta hydrolase superfamily lysophospholipase
MWKWIAGTLMIILTLLGTLLLMLFRWPLSLGSIASPKDPSANYASALARVARLQAQDDERVNLRCRTRLLTHQRRTQKAIVLLHGFTSCPHQYNRLAEEFYTQGYNVLIPRMPYHGLSDRLSEDLAQLTAEKLTDLTSEAINIAHGLGDEVTVLGFSMGGVAATWVAQNCGTVDRAVIISPALAIQPIPAEYTRPAVTFYRFWPNRFVWWDEETRDAPAEPLHAYPRLATRALAEFLRLGLITQAQVAAVPPAAKSILVVTNACDEAVNNQVIKQVVEKWRQHGATVETYEFGPELGLIHDFIDPLQQKQQIEVAYPILVELVTQ